VIHHLSCIIFRMVEIDGSFGEGGGQILRSSLALSLVTGKPFHLWNIRAGREKPGLQPQHLMSVRAAATVGQARVRGDSKGSRELFFEPGEVKAGSYSFAIGTAGATGLVLHTVYLPLALRGHEASRITIQGGTHNTHAPCFHFNDVTWRGYLRQMGMGVKLKMLRAGFYPRGGGQIEADIEPCPQPRALRLRQRDAVNSATVLSAVAGLPESIAERQARRAAHRLKGLGIAPRVVEESWPGGPGTVLAVTLPTAPVPTLFFGLGVRGKPAERVADEAVEQVRDFVEAETGAIDPHSADQIVLPLALAPGPSEFTVSAVTQHLLTNIAVIRKFVERVIECDGEEGRPGVVRIG
jgi:RNA 3'-terminal phosphate cyclase (ATP)